MHAFDMMKPGLEISRQAIRKFNERFEYAKVHYFAEQTFPGFCGNWLHKNPDAEKYRVKTGDTIGVCYNEKDFIDYLNQYICDEQSSLVTSLTEVYAGDELSEEYAGLPYFNFWQIAIYRRVK